MFQVSIRQSVCMCVVRLPNDHGPVIFLSHFHSYFLFFISHPYYLVMFARAVFRSMRAVAGRPSGSSGASRFPVYVGVAVRRRGFAGQLERVSVRFRSHDGSVEKMVKARVGGTLLDAAHENDIDVEGACTQLSTTI